MNADTFNSRYEVGQPVVAFPGAREGDGVVTKTRTPAWKTEYGRDAVMVEGRAGWFYLTHVDPICGNQCPNHDHVCLRSPAHQAGICRDEKQKGTQSCTWDPRQISAAVKGLARLVASAGEGCWIMRTPNNCALLVPEGERLVFRRSFKRPTVDVAVRLGLVVLGVERRPVPPFVGAPSWLVDFGFDSRTGTWALDGRTIAAGGGAK